MIELLEQPTAIDKDVELFYIDLFCGAGGVTTGVNKAKHKGKRLAKVIACVNHDANAIKSHAANHPDALHFVEDIRTLGLEPIITLIAEYRKLYPNAKFVLWASLECTNFSNAKGGMSRDADSRTLAEHLYRYIEALNPDIIQIENVREFMGWGPLRIKCSKMHPDRCDLAVVAKPKDDSDHPYHLVPESRKNGKYFQLWKEHIEDYGYRYDHRLLNSADFGAYTSRIRYFAQFVKHGLPMIWPTPTHARNPCKGNMFGSMHKWKAVRDVLDFEDEGESIFNRSTPLVENTLHRIYAGLLKHVAKGSSAFITKYLGNDAKTGVNNGCSIADPAPTVTTQNRLYLTQASFISKYYGAIEGQSSSIDAPAGTLTTKDRMTLVNACWLDKNYSGEQNHSSIDEPAGTIMTNNKLALMQAQSWIMPTSFTNEGRPVDEPCPTILASRKHHYIVNPQYSSEGASIDNPAHTLIARMDKRPLSLVTVDTQPNPDSSHLVVLENGQLAVVVYETDSAYMRLIKELMSELGIVDIKMRMLKVIELKLIQGFPLDYYLAGNQSEQKKFIGNSVVPEVACALAKAVALALKEMSYSLF